MGTARRGRFVDAWRGGTPRARRHVPRGRWLTTAAAICCAGAAVGPATAGAAEGAAAAKPSQPPITAVADGGWRQAHAGRSITFPERIDKGMIELRHGRDRLAFAPVGARGKFAVKGTSAGVVSALPGVGLSYSAASTGLKELLVLRDRRSGRRFSFRIESDDLVPRRTAAGGVDFRDGRGRTRFAITPPFMFDSAGAVSRAVKFRLRRQAGGHRLTVTASRAWLASPKRKWPVAVDPTVAFCSVKPGAGLACLTPGVPRSCQYRPVSVCRPGVDPKSVTLPGGNSLQEVCTVYSTSTTCRVPALNLNCLVEANLLIPTCFGTPPGSVETPDPRCLAEVMLLIPTCIGVNVGPPGGIVVTPPGSTSPITIGTVPVGDNTVPNVCGPGVLGCDRDGDGVLDNQDECPTTYGSPGARGCPDRDGDGVPDHRDACPDEAAPGTSDGCLPDTDGDGVPDPRDRCPDRPGSAALQGCPDGDHDGVADIDDRCPAEYGSASLGGCPDRDQDGVADPDDRCPDAAGPGQTGGCPPEPDPEPEPPDGPSGQDPGDTDAWNGDPYETHDSTETAGPMHDTNSSTSAGLRCPASDLVYADVIFDSFSSIAGPVTDQAPAKTQLQVLQAVLEMLPVPPSLMELSPVQVSPAERRYVVVKNGQPRLILKMTNVGHGWNATSLAACGEYVRPTTNVPLPTKR